MKKKFTILDLVIHVVLIVACLTCILPFVNLLAISFSDGTAVMAGKVSFWPVDFTLSAYKLAFRGGRFVRSMCNSILYTLVGTLINLVLMALTAYPLSKSSKQVAGRNIYMVFFAITMIIGGGMIPTYLVVSKLGLKDSIWALVLPGAVPVYNMLILMNFIRGLPEALEEAAIIDGATPFQRLVKIILPLMKPALATVGLFSMVGHWNNWFNGMIYMNDINKYPLQTYLQSLLTNFDMLMKEASSSGEIESILQQVSTRNGRAAQLFLASLPVILVYPFLQKYFTQGLVIGSVKG